MIVGIIGVGLLGGSMGYILRKKSWASKVIGIGRNEVKLKKALELKAIDEYIIEFNDKMKEIDILVICVPVQMIPSFVKQSIPFLKSGVIITDVGSTKKDITEEIENIIPENMYFVGGHPMAGSEKTGVEALDPYLFENAVYVVTKTKKTDKNAIEKIKEMAKVLDSNVLEMEPDSHDLAVSTISHVPHVIAASLVNCADNIDNNKNYILPLAAGGFRDTTRIASGSPDMWKDICITNSGKIVEVIEKFEEEVIIFKNAVKRKDEKELEELFKKAKIVRDSIPKKRKGIISPMTEIVIFVPDKPGVIGEVANLFGKENINIKDIEVLHVRENQGGSIRLGIDIENETKAIDILKKNNYEIKVLE